MEGVKEHENYDFCPLVNLLYVPIFFSLHNLFNVTHRYCKVLLTNNTYDENVVLYLTEASV